MSFFNKLQKALGFSYEDEQTEMQQPTTPLAAVAAHNGTNFTVEAPPERHSDTAGSNPAPSGGSDTDGVDVTLVFKGVIEVLNRELPPFLKNNLYEDGQRKFIYDSLEEGIKAHLAAVEEAQRLKAQKLREQEREKGRRNLEELKEKLRATEEHYSTEKEKAMSAERQKRALASRINDLESRIAALEAEKEQFEMENRSLLNKLRVAEVTAQMGDPEHLQQLLNQIDGQKKEIEAAATENSLLKEEHAKARQKADETETRNNELTGRCEELAKALETAKAQKEEAERREAATRENAARRETELKEESSRREKALKEDAERNAQKLAAEALEWKTKYEESLSQNRSKEQKTEPVQQVPLQRNDAPLYDFISFDTKETEKAPVSEAPAKDSKKTAETHQPEIKTPQAAKGAKETPERKKSTKKTQPARMDIDELLDDTDWLIDEGAPAENPDLVVPPSQQTGKKNDGANDRPSQMSLW